MQADPVVSLLAGAVPLGASGAPVALGPDSLAAFGAAVLSAQMRGSARPRGIGLRAALRHLAIG
jgi:hypothetical protein